MSITTLPRRVVGAIAHHPVALTGAVDGGVVAAFDVAHFMRAAAHAMHLNGERTQYPMKDMRDALVSSNTLASWGALEAALTAEIQRIAGARLGVAPSHYEVSNFSILSQRGLTPEQFPHIDAVEGEQFIMALSDDTKATHVYAGPLLYEVHDVDATESPYLQKLTRYFGERIVTHRERLCRAPGIESRACEATLLCLSRSELDAKMINTPDTPLLAGQISGLLGGTIHAGPESVWADRTVVFCTGIRQPGEPYKADSQESPVTAAHDFNSAVLIVAKSVEYFEHKNWRYLEDPRLRHVLDTLFGRTDQWPDVAISRFAIRVVRHFTEKRPPLREDVRQLVQQAFDDRVPYDTSDYICAYLGAAWEVPVSVVWGDTYYTGVTRFVSADPQRHDMWVDYPDGDRQLLGFGVNVNNETALSFDTWVKYFKGEGANLSGGSVVAARPRGRPRGRPRNNTA